MGRFSFVVSVTLNAGLLTFIGIALYAAYLEAPGERQLGWGLLWISSLPAMLLLSIAASRVFPRHVSTRKLARMTSWYVGAVVGVAAGALATTSFLLHLWSLAAA